MNFSVASMLGEIERIVSFGIRRPGYDEGLKTEQYLLGRFNELGLSDTRLEPVPVTYWRPATSRLSVGDAATDVACFAVPFTGWTAETFWGQYGRAGQFLRGRTTSILRSCLTAI